MSLNYLWLLLALIFPMALSAQTTQICNETPANSPTHVHPDCYEGVRIEAAGDPNCFDGKATIKSGDNIDFFATESVTLNAGFSTEVGAQFHAEVVNSLEEGCAQNASDDSFCGYHFKSTLPDVEDILVYDRFGNGYTAEEVRVPDTGAARGFDNCACEDLGIDTAPFDIWFEDCELNLGVGFNDPQNGAQRRRVFCEVYAEIAGLIKPVENVCTVEFPIINIQVLPSIPLPASSYNGTALDDFEEGVLGYGGPYIIENDFGLMDGLPFLILTTGEISSRLPNSNFYHGLVRINYAPNHNVDWYEDSASPTPNNNAQQFDLKSVVFHEAMHGLGFYTYMIGTDINDDPVVREETIHHSRFNSHLTLSNHNNLPDGTSFINRQGFKWVLDPNIELPQDILSGCNAGNGPDFFFVDEERNLNIPVLADGTSRRRALGTLSHLNEECGGGNSYLMHFSLLPGIRKPLSTEEKKVLCTLGYTLSNDSGIDCGCTIAGGDEFGSNCAVNYVMSCMETLPILKSDLLANDPSNGSTAEKDILLIDVMKPLMGMLSPDGENYLFTPARPGRVVLHYVPIGCEDNIEGNTTYVHIDVLPEKDCIGFCAHTSQIPPDKIVIQNNDCGQLISPCNLVCNPEFCGTVYGELSRRKQGSIQAYSNNPTRLNDAEMPGWVATHGSPDLILIPTIIEGTAQITGGVERLNDIPRSEGLLTLIDLEVNKDYFISYNYIGKGIFYTDLVDANAMDYTYHHDRLAKYDGITPINVKTETTSSESGFTRTITDCVNIPTTQYNSLWIYGDLGSPQTDAYHDFDNVEVVEDNFTAGSDQTIDCGQSTNLGSEFCMMANIEVEYIWTANGNTVARYRTLNGNLEVLEGTVNTTDYTIVVAPTMTTTYTLRRSVIGYTGPQDDDFAFCKDTDEVRITVNNNLSDAGFTYTITDCELEATFNSNNQSPNITHFWDFGDGTTSTEINPIHSFPNNGDYTVTHTISNACGSVNETQSITIMDCSGGVTCMNSSNQVVIGIDHRTETLLSDAIQSDPNLSNSQTSNKKITINGTLIIDVAQYLFLNCEFTMAPGSSIIVQNKLEIRGNTALQSTIKGCEYLWKGIEVKSSGKLLLSYTTISDAQFAIKANKNAHIEFNSNEFTRNFVSYYIPSNNGVPQMVTFVEKGSVFDTFDSNLKPQHTDVVYWESPQPIITNRPFCAFWLNDLSGFDIGTPKNANASYQATEIRRIGHGVIAENSTLSIVRTNFMNIGPSIYDIYGGSSGLLGSGVYGKNSTINILGSGDNKTVFTQDTHNGVYGDNSNVNMQNGVFDSYIGIKCINSINKEIIIKNNVIEFITRGIELMNNQPSLSLRVEGNQINARLNNVGGTAINIVEDQLTAHSSLNYLIKSNTINIEKGYGVTMMNLKGAEILDNTISFNQLDQLNLSSGFRLSFCRQLLFYNNSVQGLSDIPLSIEKEGALYGFFIFNSEENTFCCNTLKNLGTGINCIGVCNPSHLSGNELDNYFYGLDLSTQNTIIGDQIHTGNIWNGVHPNAGSDTYDAIHASDDQNVIRSSNFFVKVFPTKVMPASDWFDLSSGTDLICSSDNQICEEEGRAFNSTDETIASEGISIMKPVLNYKLQSDLYRRIGDKYEVGESVEPIYENYYQSKVNENIGEFDLWERLLKEGRILSIEQKQSLVDNQIHINELFSLLAMLNLELTNPNLNIEETQLLIAEKQVYYSQMLELASTQTELEKTIQQEQIEEIDLLSDKNANINTTEIYEINEQKVNKIFLNTIGKYIFELTATQEMELRTIAEQCWQTGGRAVYRARALLMILAGYEEVAFSDTCDQIEPRSITKTQLNRLTMKLIPNPSKDGHITMSLSSSLKKEAVFTIYNVFGKVVYQSNLHREENKHFFSLSNLAKGIYFTHLKLDDDTVLVEKLLLFK